MVGYLIGSACGNKIASNLAKLQEHTSNYSVFWTI